MLIMLLDLWTFTKGGGAGKQKHFISHFDSTEITEVNLSDFVYRLSWRFLSIRQNSDKWRETFMNQSVDKFW